MTPYLTSSIALHFKYGENIITFTYEPLPTKMSQLPKKTLDHFAVYPSEDLQFSQHFAVLLWVHVGDVHND